jgi:hypothetical protein
MYLKNHGIFKMAKNTYKNTLSQLTDSIVNSNSKNVLDLISERPKTSKETALNVYIEGYKIRLHSAVASSYPALQNYLGAKVFDDLIAQFIATTKSDSYNLDFYPFKFVDFFKLNSHDVFANELCQLECAIQQVFFMPDSDALNMIDISLIAPENLGKTFLYMRNASLILDFKTNANQYLSEFRNENIIEVANQPTKILIYRHENLVKRIELDELQFDFLSQVIAHKNLEEIFDKFAEMRNVVYSEVRILECFKNAVESGFFKYVEPEIIYQ